MSYYGYRQQVYVGNQVEYTVEKIVRKMNVAGHPYYYIKWKGFPSSENTWEPKENLSTCDQLIQEFESNHHEEIGRNGKVVCVAGAKKPTYRKSGVQDEIQHHEETETNPRGFERGLRPEKIIGTTALQDQLLFVVKWINHDVVDLVTCEEVNRRCPELVSKFYEERQSWPVREDYD